MNRNELLQYIQQEYVCDVDYPWERYPDYIVIRRRDNQKWGYRTKSVAILVPKIGK